MEDNRRATSLKKLENAYNDLKDNTINLNNYIHIEGIPFRKIECIAENGIVFDSNIFNIFIKYIINGIVNEFAVYGPLNDHFTVNDGIIEDKNSKLTVYNPNIDNDKIINKINIDTTFGNEFIKYIEDIIITRYHIISTYEYYYNLDDDERVIDRILDDALETVHPSRLNELKHEIDELANKLDASYYHDC